MSRSLSESASLQIDSLLREALTHACAQALYFTDRGGYILGQHARRELPMEDNFVALIAGAFYASQQAAQLLGDTDFRSMVERGRHSSVLVQALDADHLVIMVFGADSNVGLAKLHGKALADRLNPIVGEMKSAPPAAPAFEMDASRPVFQLARS